MSQCFFRDTLFVVCFFFWFSHYNLGIKYSMRRTINRLVVSVPCLSAKLAAAASQELLVIALPLPTLLCPSPCKGTILREMDLGIGRDGYPDSRCLEKGQG